jgi:hypothetical protein
MLGARGSVVVEAPCYKRANQSHGEKNNRIGKYVDKGFACIIL